LVARPGCRGPEIRTILVKRPISDRAELEDLPDTAVEGRFTEMNRYVGVDLGIRTAHKAAVLDGPQRRGKPFSVAVSREGFEELLRRATAGAEGPVQFVLDPTGLAWVPLAAYVSAAGHQVSLVKPQKASQLRKFLHQHTKTDPVDAETLARLPQIDPDGVHALKLPTAEQMTLRRLVTRRERLMRQASDQKRRIHALMVMANPSLMSALGGAAFGEGALAFYRSYADPEKVVKLGRAGLRKFWDHHSKGKADPELPVRVFEACLKTVELYGDLRGRGRLPFDYAQIQEELRAELDWMQRAEEGAKGLDARILAIYRCWDPDRTLETIMGIGGVIAPSVEALVGNIERFRNGRRFIGYCGLCPRKKQSGMIDQPMPITKAGQRLLKKYFYLAAETARHWDPDFAAYYARRYARGDDHNRIIVALARKMALRVYAVLKRREHARQATEQKQPIGPVGYVLRNPEDQSIVDKKQARSLILEKYTRDLANPERSKRDRARRGKTEVTAPAKVEWPSKDATSEKPVPPSQPEIARRRIERNQVRRDDWVSIEEVLTQILGKTVVEVVENLRKACGPGCGQPAFSYQKNS
jgi:transposase